MYENGIGRLEIGAEFERADVIVLEAVTDDPGKGLLVFVAFTDTEYGVSGYSEEITTLVPVVV